MSGFVAHDLSGYMGYMGYMGSQKVTHQEADGMVTGDSQLNANLRCAASCSSSHFLRGRPPP